MSEVVVVPFAPSQPIKARREPRPDPGPPTLYPSRVARQLALAHALQCRLAAGEFRNPAAMARALGFTRARITQLLNLLLLAPDIQEEILFLELPAGNQLIHEADLRAVGRSLFWNEQRRRWRELRSQDWLFNARTSRMMNQRSTCWNEVRVLTNR